MKSIIPFTKELDFKTKVSEITSISLEREFEVNSFPTRRSSDLKQK